MRRSPRAEIDAPGCRPVGAAERGRAAPRGSVRDLAEQALLEGYVPVGVLINAEFDVLHIHGRTGQYLELAAGMPV